VNDANGRLAELSKELDLATRPFSAEKSEEKFAGHVTLARVNRISRAQAETLMKSAERMANTTFGEWTANEVDLMKSELSPQGARHTVVATIALGGIH
jgi:2'-5' RNA ligase